MYSFNISKINFLLLNLGVILIYSLIYYQFGDTTNFIMIKNDKNDKNDKNHEKDHLTYIDSIYLSGSLYSTIGTGEFRPRSNFMKLIYITQICVLISMFVVFTHII